MDEILASFADVASVLREGRLTELPAAARRMEVAIAAGRARPPAEAERLREEAGRLKRQLEAAARGIRAAQARLTDIRSARQSATYDGAGRRRSLSPAETVAKRF